MNVAFLQPLAIDSDTLSNLTAELSGTFRHLALHSHDQFLPTPVTILPSGSETGDYLAIDVGGTHFRCAIVQLNPGRGPQMRYHRSWPIEHHLKLARPEDLFAWIGGCVARVVNDFCVGNTCERLRDRVLPIGVTFSFPMIQKSISEATLMPMGKGFAVGNNLELGELLLQGYHRHRSVDTSLAIAQDSQHGIGAEPPRIQSLPPLRIAAITNDTVATLASLAYSTQASIDEKISMGLVLGTGTNAAISMKIRDLNSSKQTSIASCDSVDLENASVVVNTEWSINGSAAPLHQLGLITEWDEQLDKNSTAPGFQPLEYMTAGKYLGEIVRLVMCDYLVNEEKTDPEHLPKRLTCKDGISTEFLSSFVSASVEISALLQLLETTFPSPYDADWTWNDSRVELLKRATLAVSSRAAALIAAATVALLICAGELTLYNPQASNTNLSNGDFEVTQTLVVAYTGSTIEKYPGFLETVQRQIDALVDCMTKDRCKRVTLREAVDGGIIGAGVLAATVWALIQERGTLLV